VAQDVYQHTFPNGLTLLLEHMDAVRSAALNFMVPAGYAFDPPDHPGLAGVLADLLTRGAGDRDSRALTLALDGLGLDRDESAGVMHLRCWGSTLARNLLPALELYADVLRRPHLPEDELEPVQALAIQDIQALEDEPRGKLLVELRKHHFPAPLGRDRRGTVEGIESLTILSVAGNVAWQPLFDTVGRLFGDWAPAPAVPTYTLTPGLGRRAHLTKDTKQTQIGIAYDSVPVGHPDYYVALAAINVLGGGMSSRLFTEVREKRGLCYGVYASYQPFRDRAAVICFDSSKHEDAQPALDVMLAELARLPKGIEPDEVSRVQAGLKSSLIMQEESTSARAGSIAADWYYLGRVRSFDEIQQAINGLTPAALADHLGRFPPRDFTIVTLGPNPLQC
jgi:predicted Zn-dependent peptidase